MVTRSRYGFSLVELLVVLFILALLFALIWPAINADRGSRRSQCLNNMKNISLAAANYASAHAGHLPALVEGNRGWPRQLLPNLDQPELVRAMNEPSWRDENAPYLEVFACPQDDDSYEQPAGLSYAINAGYGLFPVNQKTGAITETGTHSLAQDWNADGEVSEEDKIITRATGLAWRPDDDVPPLTVEDIAAADGLGTTLLFAENLHAGPWTSRDTSALAFVIGRDRLTFNNAKGPLALQSANLGPFAMNSVDTDIPGPVPAPSSNHDGTITVSFADGRASSVADTIDPLVYARLLSSQGSLYGQKNVNETDYEPPLAYPQRCVSCDNHFRKTPSRAPHGTERMRRSASRVRAFAIQATLAPSPLHPSHSHSLFIRVFRGLSPYARFVPVDATADEFSLDA